VCYAGVVQPDAVTEEFRRHAVLWRCTTGLTAEAFAEMVHHDAWTSWWISPAQWPERLPVFARRPAPVQISFAGYPESTELDAIVTGSAIGFWNRRSEIGIAARMEGPPRVSNSSVRSPRRAVFLIDSFWCYDPCGIEIGGHGLPAQESECVTFAA